MLLFITTGCALQGLLDDANGTFGGLTHPLVTEGWFIGVAQPDPAEIDLSETPFDETAVFDLFLIDAGSLEQFDEGPVRGAEVQVDGLALTEAPEGGVYSATDRNGLVYTDHGESLVTIQIGDGMAEATVATPPPPTTTLPAQGERGEDLTVDLLGQGFHNVLVVVVDMESLEMVWTNNPQTASDAYEFTSGEVVSQVSVPGETFAESGQYIVGVAGTENADPETFVGLNTALSSVVAGKLRFSRYLVP